LSLSDEYKYSGAEAMLIANGIAGKEPYTLVHFKYNKISVVASSDNHIKSSTAKRATVSLIKTDSK